MPEESILYFGDQGHIPYGPRPLEQIREFSEAITKFLLERNAKIIVVACNTASAAALKYLREKFPSIQFVGMEPAVKPAAETTQTNKVGVLATQATFQGALYASVVERFANGVELFQNTCNGLVQQIEQGNLQGSETRKILEDVLHPMLEKNIDTVVLGYTHYPFVIPLDSIYAPTLLTDTDTASVVILLVPMPSIDVEKYISVNGGTKWLDEDTPTGPYFVCGGANPQFKFVVTNTGNVDLTSVSLTDSDFDLSGCTIPATLLVSGSFQCIITAPSCVAGQHTNTATADGYYSGTKYSDADDAHYYGLKLDENLMIEVTKTATRLRFLRPAETCCSPS